MGFRPKQPQLTLLWFPFILSFFPLPLNFFFSSREQHGQREWNENKSFCWSGSSLRQRSLRLITHLFKKRRGSSSTNLFIHSTILPFIQSIFIWLKGRVEWNGLSSLYERDELAAPMNEEERRRKQRGLAQLHSQNKFHFHLFCWIPLCLAALRLVHHSAIPTEFMIDFDFILTQSKINSFKFSWIASFIMNCCVELNLLVLFVDVRFFGRSHWLRCSP